MGCNVRTLDFQSFLWTCAMYRICSEFRNSNTPSLDIILPLPRCSAIYIDGTHPRGVNLALWLSKFGGHYSVDWTNGQTFDLN